MDEEEIPAASMIDTPVDLRPDLSIYGIEEFDKGICEDSQANRQILRKNKLSHHPIYDAQGHPTGQIEVISHAMSEGRSLTTLSDRKTILETPTDPNSNYLTGLDLLYHGQADKMVPPWIMSATREYDKITDQRDANPGKKIRPNLTSFPSRCRYIKADGIRCLHWSAGRATDDGLCRTHLGALNANAGTGSVERARQRVQQSAARAVDVLEELMDEATGENVRLKAATELLDRAGVRGGVEVDVSGTVDHKPAAEMLAERLDRLAKAAIEANKPTVKDDTSDMMVLDAEVIEDDDNDGR